GRPAGGARRGPVTSSLLGVGLAMAVVVVASRALARRTGVPYPVFLVVAGAAGSFVPGVPAIHLDPKVVFFGFLPPLIYHAGLVTSPRELRAHALPIGLGAFGLVLATTFAVAGSAWAAVPALGWAGAFVLGAVVAPTDPVAATSVLGRLGAPPGLTTVLEGESLVNDGIALSLLTLGVAAVSSPIGLGGGLVTFVRLVAGGVGFGLVVGWAATRLRRPMRDTASEIVVSLLVPFVAYLLADALGLSGVLATLTTGLMLGQQGSHGIGPGGRIRVAEFWQVLVFLLESVLFVLVGFQLRSIVDGLSPGRPGHGALLAGVTVGAVVVVRLIWWLAVPTLRWRPEQRILDTGEVPWQDRVALGWCGLRGAISLAAALSIPTVVRGRPFPERNLVVFAAFCVVVATLVGQGTSLTWLLRKLSLVGSDVEQRQHALADRRCIEGALLCLDEMSATHHVPDAVADTLRQAYERRLDRLRSQLDDDIPDPTGLTLAAVRHRLIERQHQVLRRLYRDGEISFTVMRQVRRELDLEQASLDP
ncbi:MAG: Na+/H+ antiporter, partial [Acidimicrobiales bacterium]